MRSSDWEYLGFVLVGVGGVLVASGSVAFFYFQKNLGRSSQYGPYLIPMLIVGICVVVAGIFAFLRSRRRRKAEIGSGLNLPPPPVPPPPPPPPPP